MRGTIHYCLEETIIQKYGSEKWAECLTSMGLPASHSFATQIIDDIDEDLTMNFIKNVPNVLGCSLQQIFDDFGMYWSTIYAPKLYKMFYIGANNTKEMVLKMTSIHQSVAKVREGATPPMFEFREIAPNKTEVTYFSQRNLFDLYISLVKGLDAYFKNTTQIEKTSDNSAIMTFSHY
ncbi:MAG: heme NO-binding domain-containing protein [Thermonemataceae bacterium]|nr:heme NO-binding domain-containing protein [Thermonemataceae bacterium]